MLRFVWILISARAIDHGCKYPRTRKFRKVFTEGNPRKTYMSHIVRNSSFCICVYFWFESVFGLGRVLWPQMDNQTSPINLYMSPLWQSITLTSLFYTLYSATTEFLLYFTNQNDENARGQLSISRKLEQSLLWSILWV